jgi:hypothetical protein
VARLVDEALEAIGSGDPDVAAEGVRLSASFFEHSLGRVDGLDRDEVLAEPATPAEVRQLRDRLADLVRAGAPAPVAGAAVFALGKLHDAELRPFFVGVLRRYLAGDAGVLYQAMIALDNLEVPVFAGARSASVRLEGENRALAAEFLRRSEAGNGA